MRLQNCSKAVCKERVFKYLINKYENDDENNNDNNDDANNNNINNNNNNNNNNNRQRKIDLLFSVTTLKSKC